MFSRCRADAGLPVAEALSEEALSLPVFPEMTEEEQELVIGALWEFSRIERR